MRTGDQIAQTMNADVPADANGYAFDDAARLWRPCPAIFKRHGRVAVPAAAPLCAQRGRPNVQLALLARLFARQAGCRLELRGSLVRGWRCSAGHHRRPQWPVLVPVFLTWG